MSHIDSDLEEGEILDSPPSPSISDKKSKELPRRYIIREYKNSAHKHKKDCKYAIHHHAKKPSKLKKTPGKVRNSYKKYHKPTCSREKSHKDFDRCINSDILKPLLSKNGHSFSQHSLISEMKGIKGVRDLVNKERTKSAKLEKSDTKNNKTPKKDISNSQANKKCKSSDFHLQNISNDSEQLDAHTNENIDAMPDIIILSSGNETPIPELIDLSPDISTKDVDDVILNKSPEVKNEESEDEEELRRIALATCAKRKVVSESCKSSIQNIDNSVTAPEPEVNNVQISCREMSSPVFDNYEVVDMEVDDDDGEESAEIIQTSIPTHVSDCSENLFVIDTNPSVDFLSNKENSCSETRTDNNSTDEEFEVDILRAELIDSMYRKKFQDKQVEQSDNNVPQKPVPVIPEKRVVNYQKPHVNFHHRSLRTTKHVIRRNAVSKSNLKSRTVKTLPPVPLKEPPERLIIALNEESSSEESDNPDEGNPAPENPVESIVALISDCRQKSESSEKAKEPEKPVPKAVECLSKAQQEEYNSLMKILAEKKKAPASQDVLSQKNGFSLDSLKEMEGKLTGLREALNAKKLSMTSLSKEVNSKKFHYMKAKLSAQHLKEQYIAAEKVRKAKLLVWSDACKHLKLVKQSVSDLESKINRLQKICSKIGLSVQGKSKLSLSSDNKEQ